MPRIRTMGAGLGGSTAKNLNVNGNTGGGNKKQGLATTTNTGVSFASNAIKNKAYGENRDFIFCVNQLGGIGGKSKMFATTADGVKDCVEGPDCPVLEVKEAYMTVFGRHPDASGIKTYCDNFRKKNWTLEMIIIDLINSAEGQAILAALTPNFSNIVINLDTTDTTSLSGSGSPQIFDAASALLEVKNRLALYLSSTSESVNSLTGLTYGQVFANLGGNFHPSNISTAADSDNQFVAGAQGSYVFDGTFSIDLYAFGTISNSFSVTVNLTDNGNPTFATQGQGGGTYEGNAEGGFSNSGFVGFPMAFDNWGTFAAVTATIQNPNYSYGSGLGNAHAFTEDDADNQFFYALGSNYIVFLATDASGNTASQTIEVIVKDTTAPTLNVPILSFPLANVANYTLEGNTTGGATETITFPTATDDVDPNVSVTATIQNPNHDYGSGLGNEHAFTEDDATDFFFALGTNYIVFLATDASNNTDSQTIEVEVVDTIAPDFSITEEATDENNSVFSISSSTATILEGNTTGGANGITFTVTESATDDVDDSVQVTATIVNSTYDYGSGTNAAHAFTAANAANSAFVYGLGLSTMQFTATDSSGNSTQYSRYINIEDNTNPLLEGIPPNQGQVEGNTTGGADAITVIFPTATDDVDDSVQVTATIVNSTYDYGSGTNAAHAFTAANAANPAFVYGLGNTEIIFKATDSSGNFATHTTVIEVLDTTSPQLVWSGAQVGGTYEGNEIGGASAITVIFPTASDIVDANVQVTAMIQNDQNHNYGSGAGNAHAFTENDAADLTFVYGVGTSTITFTATDSSNNTDSDTIVVIVEDTTAPVFTAGTTNWTQTTTYNDTAIQALGENGGQALSWVLGGADGFAFTVLPSANDDVDGPITPLDVSLTNDGVAVTGYTLTDAQDSTYVYGVGANVITFTATDSSGNSSTEVVELIIEDDVAPVFGTQWTSLNSQTGQISANVADGYQATSSVSMLVDSVAVAASDAVDGSVAVIATIYNSDYPTGLPDFEEQDSSGNFYTFPMGVNTITYEATDSSNNTATGNIRQFTVVDNTAPNFYNGVNGMAIVDQTVGLGPYALVFKSTQGQLPVQATLEGNVSGGRDGLQFMEDSTTPVSNFKKYTYNGVVGGNNSTGITCTATIQNPNHDYSSGVGNAHTFTENDAADLTFVYGVGTSTITFTATDQYGNSVNKYIQIVVEDTTAPVITESPMSLNLSPTSNFTWEADSVDANGVGYIGHTFGAFTASDVVDPNVTLSASLTVGGVADQGFTLADVNNTSYDFPIGTSVLTISATDSSNNTTNNVYNITVVNPGPSLTVPTSLTLIANTSGGGDGLTPTFATASGIFPTTVSATIQNPDYNYGSGTSNAHEFTVSDANAPAFVYGLGVNTITFTATDTAGATSTDYTVITVQDSSPPVFTNINDINWTPTTTYNDAAIQAAAPNLAWTNGNVLPAGTPGGATGFRFATLPLANDVVDGPITTLDVSLTNDGVEIPGYDEASALAGGQVYRPGTNVITFTATDSSGNTGTLAIELIIEDDVAPTITTQAVDTYVGNVGAIPGTYSTPQTFSSLVANAAFPALNFVTNYGAQATDNVDLDASSPVLSHVSLYETHTYVTGQATSLDKLHQIEVDLTGQSGTQLTVSGANNHDFNVGDLVRILHNSTALNNGGYYANGNPLAMDHEELYVIHNYNYDSINGMHQFEFRIPGTNIPISLPVPDIQSHSVYTIAIIKHVAGTISAGNTFTSNATLLPGIYRSTYRATDTSGNKSYQDVDFQITN